MKKIPFSILTVVFVFVVLAVCENSVFAGSSKNIITVSDQQPSVTKIINPPPNCNSNNKPTPFYGGPTAIQFELLQGSPVSVRIQYSQTESNYPNNAPSPFSLDQSNKKARKVFHYYDDAGYKQYVVKLNGSGSSTVSVVTETE